MFFTEFYAGMEAQWPTDPRYYCSRSEVNKLKPTG